MLRKQAFLTASHKHSPGPPPIGAKRSCLEISPATSFTCSPKGNWTFVFLSLFKVMDELWELSTNHLEKIRPRKKSVLLEMLVLGVSMENFYEETEKWVCVPGNCKGATLWETVYLNNCVEDCKLKTVN